MDINEFVSLAERVHNAEGMNFGSTSTRDSRNAHWARIVGIAHFGHPSYNPTPDSQWHIKRVPGHPQSDDVVVSLPSREFWDCIPGSGADGYRFQASGPEMLPTDQEAYAPPVPDGGGGVTNTASYWTSAHEAVLLKFVNDFRWPNTLGDVEYVTALAQQLKFSFPGEDWGTKSTGLTTPISNNVVALQVGNGLFGYKVVPNPTAPPNQLDISAQTFHSVEPRNYLQVILPPPVQPPVQPPNPLPVPPVETSPGELTDVLSAVKALVVENQKQSALLDEFVALAKNSDNTELTNQLRDLNVRLGKGFSFKAKGGWPIGNLTADITPKE